MKARGGRSWAESDGPGLGHALPLHIARGAIGCGPRHARFGARLENERGAGRRRADGCGAWTMTPRPCESFGHLLEKAGYPVVVTGAPEEVPGLLEAERPQLAPLDLLLAIRLDADMATRALVGTEAISHPPTSLLPLASRVSTHA